jgi:hypothetical protein
MTLARQIRVGAIPLISGLLLTLGCGAGEMKKEAPPPVAPPLATQPTVKADTPTASKKVDFQLAADEMVKECLADLKAGEAKYVGKRVELTGLLHLAHPVSGTWVAGVKKSPDDDGVNVECNGLPRIRR